MTVEESQENVRGWSLSSLRSASLSPLGRLTVAIVTASALLSAPPQRPLGSNFERNLATAVKNPAVLIPPEMSLATYVEEYLDSFAEESRIHGSLETALGHLPIVGFEVRIPYARLEQYFAELGASADKRSVELSTRGLSDTFLIEAGWRFTMLGGKIQAEAISNDDYWVPLSDERKRFFSLPLLPRLIDIRLKEEEGEWQALQKYETVPYSEECPTTKQERATAMDMAGVTIPLYSEVVLPPRVRQELCQVISQFLPFKKTTTHLYANYDTELLYNDSFFSGLFQLAQIALPLEADRGSFDLSIGVVIHELSHSLFHDLEDTEHQAHLAALEAAYGRMVANMRYRLPTEDEREAGYDVSANEPVWAMITESFYRQKIDSLDDYNGHPWDNPDEMLASCITVLRLFPQQFLEQFKHLSLPEQTALRQVVNISVGVLKALNPNPQVLHTLLPEVDNVMQALDLA